MFILLGATVVLFAQEGEEKIAAVIQYYENNSGEMLLVSPDQDEELWADDDFTIGHEIGMGYTLITGEDDFAEIELVPTQSIVKVSAETNFVVESLQGLDGAEESAFNTPVGKFRAVVGRITGDEKYSFKSPTAVCGVRGTDFGMDIFPDSKEVAFVLDGVVDYAKATGEKIELTSGMMADALGAVFEAITIPEDLMSDLMEGLDFEELDPAGVPGHAPPEPVEEVTEVEEPPAEAPAPTTLVEEPTEEEPEAAPPAAAPTEPTIFDELFETLKKVLGMEIGSVTIDGKTWSKAVLQPNIDLGTVRLGLYLPIIYEKDLFDPINDWYHPDGNDEWSFGTDKVDWENFDMELSDWIDVGLDFFSDLSLKIKYFGFGNQGDPFFFNIGNLHDINLGHGIIMRNYANDLRFPEVRRVGLNAGLDFDFFGFEGIVNDIGLKETEIIGTRLYLRPLGRLFPLAVGVSAITDINPTGTVFDPMIFHAGVDLDFPVLNLGFLRFIAFADAFGVYPLYSDPALSPVPGFDAVNDLMTYFIDNYGFAAGVFGNILMIDYRIELRSYSGAVRPAYYNELYDRARADYFNSLINDIKAQTPGDVQTTIGVYGEGGFEIKDVLNMEFGYFWPWSIDETTNEIVMGEEDYLHAEASLARGVVPFVDVAGSASYTRTQIVTPIISGAKDISEFELIDENTIIAVEGIYGIAPTLDLALLVTTSIATDETTGEKTVTPVVSIETRVHF